MRNNQPTFEENEVPQVESRISTYQEVWRIVRRRKKRIQFGVGLALVLAVLYCAVSGPWYDSSAQLFVIKKKFDTTPITGPDPGRAQEDYLSTHMLLITSRRVIAQAIEKGGLQNLEEFRDPGGIGERVHAWLTRSIFGAEPDSRREERLTTDIINSLVVTRDAQRPGINPSNEVLNLSFRGKVAADCPKILNAIIDSYQGFLKETYRNTNAETLELIAQARLTVQKDLEIKEAAYQRFLADTPLLWKAQDRSTAHQDRLFKIDARLSALRLRRAEIEAFMAMIDNAIKSGRNPTAVLERITAPPAAALGPPNPLANQEPALAARRPGASLEDELINLRLQRAKLLAIRALNHPDVSSLDRQIDAVQRMILPSSGNQREPAGRSAGEPDLAALKLELLTQELNDLQVAEQVLSKLFDNEQKGASTSYVQEIQDEAHRKGIERDRLLYESVLNRLKETSSAKDFGGYNTQVIGPALNGRLALRKYLLIFGLSLFAGLFAGFGWAYLAEAAARKMATTSSAARAEQRNSHQELVKAERKEPDCGAPPAVNANH